MIIEILKIAGYIIAIIFVVTFAVYWFNVDNKFLYYVVYPQLQKKYDKVDLTRDKGL